jgi:hypothetical protein
MPVEVSKDAGVVCSAAGKAARLWELVPIEER